MARGSETAQQTAKTAQTQNSTYAGNAGSLFGPLSGMLMNDAAHPAGMAPNDIAAADTAGMQAAGGSQAGAVGQGGLLAARTRNAGGADAAIAKSSRVAGEQAGQEAVATRLKNAGLKSQQHEAALSGLGGLFGQNANAGNQALGEVASNVNANTSAASQSWDWSRELMQPLLKAGSAALPMLGGGA